MVLDDPDELFLVQEARLWFLEDSQDELETNDLGADHVVADLLIGLWLLLSLN